MKPTAFLLLALVVCACVITSLPAKAQFDPAAEAKIDALIKKMTLEEKVNMIHASSSFTSGGVPRLGIPELTTSDGPHGVRVEHGRGWDELKNVYDSGTYLPAGVCLAATWNPQLGYAFGSVLGSEANFRGKDVILGPALILSVHHSMAATLSTRVKTPTLFPKWWLDILRACRIRVYRPA